MMNENSSTALLAPQDKERAQNWKSEDAVPSTQKPMAFLNEETKSSEAAPEVMGDQ